MHRQRHVSYSLDTLFINPRADAALDLGTFRMIAESRCASGEHSGDFFAFRLRGPNRLAGVIGDACGRGHEAAQLLPGVLSRLHELADSSVPPSQLLNNMNERLAGELASDRFVTGAAFEIDADAGTLTIANAGHVPAMVRRANGRVSLVGRASGPPLGILPQCRYLDETCRMVNGDVIVLMTDGVLEAIETDLAEMSKLRAMDAETSGGSSSIQRSLLAHLAYHQAGLRADDMTLLSLELLGDACPSSQSHFRQSA